MQANLPAYNIFPNRTLNEMAAAFPTTKEAFLKINGVGPIKWMQYGQIFLDAITQYCSENQIDPAKVSYERLARLSLSTCGDTPFERLLGHNPAVLKSWEQLAETFLTSPTFTSEFKEELRRVLAHANGCSYCMARGAPSSRVDDKKTKQAIKFAKAFAANHHAITDAYFDDLRKLFTEPELAELCAFIAFFSASQRFGAVLDLQPKKCDALAACPD